MLFTCFTRTIFRRAYCSGSGYSGSGQNLETWYAINNSPNSPSGTVSVYYSGGFDDQAMVLTAVQGRNMGSPWTSRGPQCASGSGSASLSVTTNAPSAIAFVLLGRMHSFFLLRFSDTHSTPVTYNSTHIKTERIIERGADAENTD